MDENNTKSSTESNTGTDNAEVSNEEDKSNEPLTLYGRLTKPVRKKSERVKKKIKMIRSLIGGFTLSVLGIIFLIINSHSGDPTEYSKDVIPEKTNIVVSEIMESNSCYQIKTTKGNLYCVDPTSFNNAIVGKEYRLIKTEYDYSLREVNR